MPYKLLGRISGNTALGGGVSSMGEPIMYRRMAEGVGLLVLSLLLACGSGASPGGSDPGGSDPGGGGDPGGGNGPGNGDQLDAFAIDMLAAVNQERSALGLAALTWDARLAEAAADHAQDMIDNDFEGHTGSDGSSVGDRATRAGYQWSWVGENVAWGQTSISQVMAAWMDSPGHRANILHASFSQLGAARIGNHWVQVFAHPAFQGKPDVDEAVPQGDG